MTASKCIVSQNAPAQAHPKGDSAKVLLTSVFGPYAVDDEYGSRVINPMELYHNQVTREQGAFSLRMFHRSWGLMLIKANIDAPCNLLDFPVLDRFIEEIKTKTYDIIGISAILPNMGKVQHMCKLIREHQPDAQIIIGGHLANMGGLEDRVDADHIVRGEGVRWFRAYLGEEAERPFVHPEIISGFTGKTMGFPLPDGEGKVAATLIPSVGCPLGCNFCSTSAMFGGKGKHIDFYKDGDELYDVMCKLEASMKVKSFFVMDENFLFNQKRALRLLELMEKGDKAWSLYVFSSANVLSKYTVEQLVGLGISWVWIGLEEKGSQYSKLDGIDAHELLRNLQDNGVRMLGSSIIGTENHTPENMDEVIDYAVSYNTEFHQFMLYTPLPGTPLFNEHKEAGTLLDPDFKESADSHGQLKFIHKHPHIPAGMETEMLRKAFVKDFEVNGPSVLRIVKTTLKGWKKYHNHPSKRIRDRICADADGLGTTLAGAVWGARLFFRSSPQVHKQLDELLKEMYATFGLKCRIMAPLVGLVSYFMISREDRQLKEGKTYEPPTFYDQ